MRILFVIDKLDLGGVETVVRDLALNMSHSHEVDILTNQKDNSDNTTLLLNSGIKIHYSFSSNRLNPINIFSYLRIIKRGKYDIVHAHNLRQQIIVSLVSLLLPKVKYVTTEHGQYNKKMKYPFLRKLDRFIYSRYSVVTLVSSAVKNALLNWLQIDDNKKFKTIYNGIDTKKAEEITAVDRGTFGFDGKSIILCSVGRLAVGKDFSTIIKAISLLPDQYKLIIVGEGPERENIESEIKSLDLTHRVLLAGYHSTPISIIKSCDIYVGSSMFEGFALTVIEAMASNVPIITNDILPFIEAVDNDTYIFKTSNAQDLCEKILDLELDDNYKKAQNFFKNRVTKFDLSTIVDEYIETYKSI